MNFKNYKEQSSNTNQTIGITCSTNSSSRVVVCKLIIKNSPISPILFPLHEWKNTNNFFFQSKVRSNTY